MKDDEKTLKEHQRPLTVEEQIENLEDIGLIIEDKEYAKSVLQKISYFRLIKAYSLGLKEKNGNYYEVVTFRNIVDLYTFNADFRKILFPIIESVEVSLRCNVSNFFCCKYGVLGYKNKDFFVVEEYYDEFILNIKDEIKRNSRSLFVRNFKENYDGGDLPFYALVEIVSFGTLSKFYKNLNNPDKKEIAKCYGVGYTYFESWIECLANIRNICAHYGRLYNAKLTKTPILYKEYSENKIGNNRVFGALICLKYIVKEDEWMDFIMELEKLINEYDGVDIKSMGFPKDWKEVLTQER